MLFRAGQLVKEGSLTAVLVSHQRKSQLRPFRQRISAPLGMKFAFLAKPRMLRLPARLLLFLYARCHRLHTDLRGIRQTQCKLIAMYVQFDRVPHRRQLHYRNLRPGNHPHIQKMLPQRTFAADTFHHGSFSYCKFFQRHNNTPFCLTLLSAPHIRHKQVQN